MPEISRFFGIVIAMYFDEHGPAHFHVRYGRQTVNPSDASEILKLLGDANDFPERSYVEWRTAIDQESEDLIATESAL